MRCLKHPVLLMEERSALTEYMCCDMTYITTVMCHLGKGACSEKSVVRQFRRRVSVTECITQT